MRKILLGALAGAATALSAVGATFHVDATASAGGDGSAARPFASVQAAVEGIRAARAAGAVKSGESVEVLFAPGRHFVPNGIKLSAADSGTAAAPVVWRSREAAKAVLTSGIPLPANAFTKVADPAVLARLPESARGKVYVADIAPLMPGTIPPLADTFGGTPAKPLLFTGGAFGTLARWPNDGYTSFTQGVDKGGTVRRHGAFVYDNPRARRWDFAASVWLNGYWTHDWSNHSVRAASYGSENGTNHVIRLAADVPYGVMGGTWGRKERRFFVFNLLEELDAPGEWYLDRARKRLYLMPRHGEPTASDDTTLVFSSEPVLLAQGVRHLRFERLDFAYGYGDGVSIRGDDVTVADCRVSCFGGTGLQVDGSRNRIVGVEVCRIGRTGISVSGGDRKTLTRADTVVEGCDVHHYAVFQRTYAPAIGVNGGSGITLRGNKMHDAPHSAVLYGGNEHLFESNEVYRVLMETGDAGAYYTGRDWTTQGNVLRHNYTHDLGADGEHANTMGFYFDDCDCGDEVYGNVFHNVARGIMVGGGREHPIRNNVFSRCRIGLSIDCRGMTWKHWNAHPSWMLEDKAKELDYTHGVWAARYPRLANIMNDHPREPLYNPVENNVFIDCTQQILALDGKASECLSRMAPIAGNLVINTQGTNGVKTAQIDARIAAGFRIVNGTRERPFDAGFVDAAQGDFTLKPDAWLRRAMPAFTPVR